MSKPRILNNYSTRNFSLTKNPFPKPLYLPLLSKWQLPDQSESLNIHLNRAESNLNLGSQTIWNPPLFSNIKTLGSQPLDPFEWGSKSLPHFDNCSFIL
jgi:hypothetical protein